VCIVTMAPPSVQEIAQITDEAQRKNAFVSQLRAYLEGSDDEAGVKWILSICEFLVVVGMLWTNSMLTACS
jgi:hypothetical protein